MNRVFKALSDPTRREILDLLREGDLPAGEIARQFEISWPSISHHLRVLSEANLLEVEKRGQERIYSLNTNVIRKFLVEVSALFGGQDSG